MPELANTTVSVLRGTTTNAYGDEVDASVPVYRNVPAVLVETGRDVQDPSTPAPRTIREVICQVPYWTQVTDDDQLQDEQTGNVYMVLSTTRPPTLMGAPVDLMLTLRRVSGQGA